MHRSQNIFKKMKMNSLHILKEAFLFMNIGWMLTRKF